MGASAAYIEEFLVESNENLSSIGTELLNYEKEGTREVLDNIYRKVHTLKGSAGFLGFKKLQKITHTAENILDLMREEKLTLNTDLMDALLRTFDVCNAILGVIAESGEEGDTDISEIGSVLSSLSVPGKVEEVTNSISTEKLNQLKEKEAPLVNDFKLMDGDFESALRKELEGENIAIQESVIKDVIAEKSIEVTEMAIPDVAKKPVDLKDYEHEKVEAVVVPIVEEIKVAQKTEENIGISATTSSDKTNVMDSVVRVNVNLLDRIMNLVGELVLSRNQIMQFSNTNQDHRLVKLTHDLNVITSDLQNEIMNTRMQPVGNVLSKFERLVRDLSRSQNKKVQLSILGKDTELDRTLLEAIKDPLTHIIRNSMDHGLETPEERVAAGKPEQGVINIRAFHEGGYVAIEIKDDGRGIPRDKIVAKAIEKGLVTEEEVGTWPDKKVLNLIFNPGFSTAAKVTNISGRGVGMDVVRTNIEKIGGNVLVESKEGEGSIFKLRIPLTLAIIPALIVKCLDQYFAIPQLNLAELVRIDNKSRQVEKIKNAEFLRLRDELIPIIRLNHALDINHVQFKSNEFNAETDIVECDEVEATVEEDESVIILKADGQTYGLVVDDILDTEEIVVKPLDSTFKNIKSFAGATLMGDGRVALILDPLGLWSTKGFATDKTDTTRNLGEIDLVDSKLSKNEILLFQLEDQRKYGLPISSVFRLEEFKAKEISYTGKMPIVKYMGSPMPLVNVENTLALADRSCLTMDDPERSIHSIIIRHGDRLFGVCVTEILDISLTEEKLSTHMVDRDGVSGTIFINDETVTVIDPERLVELAGLVSVQQINRIGSNYSNFKILVAEDSQLYQKLMENTLTPLGCEFDVFDNGRDALKEAKTGAYDLIITDIEMPHMNGFEFAEELRKSGQYDKTPIVAVTTRVADKDVEHGKQVGIDFHLEKLDKNEVQTIVRNCLDMIKK